MKSLSMYVKKATATKPIKPRSIKPRSGRFVYWIRKRTGPCKSNRLDWRDYDPRSTVARSDRLRHIQLAMYDLDMLLITSKRVDLEMEKDLPSLPRLDVLRSRLEILIKSYLSNLDLGTL